MSARHKILLRRTLLCGVCCASVAIPATLWLSRSSLRVRVFDSKFHVLSVSVLRSGDDRFYLGNPLEGRVRGFLRDRCHLKVKPMRELSGVARSFSGSNGCTFILRSSCEAAPSPDVMYAELVDCSGAALGVGGCWTYGTNGCFFCNLDRERTNAGDYTLKLRRGSVCLAEIELKRLPPPLPVRRILPEDVVQDSVSQWQKGTNKFDVWWIYTEAGAKKVVDFWEAHEGQKARTAIGNFKAEPGRTLFRSTPPALPSFTQWKEGWLKDRTDNISGVSEDEAKEIVAGLKNK